MKKYKPTHNYELHLYCNDISKGMKIMEFANWKGTQEFEKFNAVELKVLCVMATSAMQFLDAEYRKKLEEKR